jgi:hypothetical protein
MKIPLVVATLVALLISPAIVLAGQEGKPPASGTFTSKKISFKVGGGYAYPALSSLGQDPIIKVAVSNGEILGILVDPFLDRDKAVAKHVSDDEGALVNFEFTPAGKFDGVSYYLGSGNGCGYCSAPEMKSTVTLTGGRLVGQLTYKTKDVSWNIALDVAVASTEHGPALPANGGEPGKVYKAYAAALAGHQAAALKKLFASRRVESMAQAEKDGQLEAFLDYFAGQNDIATVKIDKGFATADTAVLVVSGTSGDSGSRAGEVVLKKEKDGWRVYFVRIEPVF